MKKKLIEYILSGFYIILFGFLIVSTAQRYFEVSPEVKMKLLIGYCKQHKDECQKKLDRLNFEHSVKQLQNYKHINN
jgi:hypothetical protein